MNRILDIVALKKILEHDYKHRVPIPRTAAAHLSRAACATHYPLPSNSPQHLLPPLALAARPIDLDTLHRHGLTGLLAQTVTSYHILCVCANPPGTPFQACPESSPGISTLT